jgi:hypothetical protein
MSCNSCKSNKGVNNVHWGITLLGVYVLFSAIYGTVQLVNTIIQHLK